MTTVLPNVDALSYPPTLHDMASFYYDCLHWPAYCWPQDDDIDNDDDADGDDEDHKGYGRDYDDTLDKTNWRWWWER